MIAQYIRSVMMYSIDAYGYVIDDIDKSYSQYAIAYMIIMSVYRFLYYSKEEYGKQCWAILDWVKKYRVALIYPMDKFACASSTEQATLELIQW